MPMTTYFALVYTHVQSERKNQKKMFFVDIFFDKKNIFAKKFTRKIKDVSRPVAHIPP